MRKLDIGFGIDETKTLVVIRADDIGEEVVHRTVLTDILIRMYPAKTVVLEQTIREALVDKMFWVVMSSWIENKRIKKEKGIWILNS